MSLNSSAILSTFLGIAAKYSVPFFSTILRELAERNIIGKRIFAEVPPRVEYSLTETGMELRQSIIPLLRWAAKYDTETRPNDCCDNNQFISII